MSAPYIPPSFGQPGVSITYRPKSLLTPTRSTTPPSTIPPITLSIPPASIHHIFAHRQWRAGMLLSDALLSSAFPTTSISILELGAGTGLPSITAALLPPAAAPLVVVASDYDEPALISELRLNVRRNVASAPDEVRKRIKVVGHIWGKNTEELLDCLPASAGGGFDSVLLADCLWDPLSHADLLKTVVRVLKREKGARVNVIAGLHTGREKVTSFIRRAYRAGLRLAPVHNPDIWPALEDDAEKQDADAARVGNEALAKAGERILELEVCGNTPIQSDSTTEEKEEAEGKEGEDEPRLTANRRLFKIEGYGEETEGDVKLRNRWLTVWSLEWAQP
ncbi:hypothetical protein NDA11_002811 [Ustilago hordei]|uniref:Uncharacterized protein n=1 Tax=Ustilago hordei TaxID=120017 RepID=I2G573_USTHO|nr:uncharacterized protein UHO2_01714 [Ustilago hordei]KAJ1586418.1 hypothetical protein NDA12_007765 [Ustilago hordei]KAJ1590799.1 hypothetical protein NDA11_002811 [Ustilago hordei]KAJ1600590.1 hypothetical protein NDA14_001674 [Ustilago hordei]UTT93598.1 hypothetical protein NDA17_000876 [Ustilago hordei]CCF54316.1 uncharacterized protein UHOR_02020 [Ustilago hordei]